MRKATFLFVLMLTSILSAMAQIKIPGTNAEFNFPNGGWKYLQTTNVDKNTNVYLYSYAARNIVDEMGDTILPHLRVYVRKNYTKDLYTLSFDRFNQQPYQTLSDFTVNQLPGALGIIGAYKNMLDNKSYEFRMVYLRDKNTVVEFRAETTLDTFDQFDQEFQSIINTLKLSTK